MTVWHRWLFLVAQSFALCGTAFGWTSAGVTIKGGAYQEPGIQVSPGVIQVGNPLSCEGPSCSQGFNSETSQTLDAAVSGSASFQNAVANAQATAHAEIGNLGLKIHASGEATQDQSLGNATAVATAEWRSGAVFDAPQFFDGVRFTVTSFLILEGNLNGNANGRLASSYADFKIESVFPGLPDAPYANGTWGSVFASNGGTRVEEIPGIIRITREFRNGFSTAIGFRFLLGGTAGSDLDDRAVFAATPGSASVTADASHSLRWGGVESVIDEFGNPVTDWTLIGENGFNFSKPFPVPEPASAAVVLGIVPVVLAKRLGRRPTVHVEQSE